MLGRTLNLMELKLHKSDPLDLCMDNTNKRSLHCQPDLTTLGKMKSKLLKDVGSWKNNIKKK